MRSVRETGYDGPYVLEIFSAGSLPDSLWRGGLTAMLARNREAFVRIYEMSRR